MSASAQGLCEFIDASPSPFHVCVTVAQRLSAAGFTELSERDEWPAEGRFFTVRAGSLVAWRSDEADRTGPFRIVGAHTDSPNLRVKQHPDRFVSGWQVVALQPYGGAWLNSWLDRDLGISGRLSVRVGDTIDHRLVRIDEPILRVPQLAIHLAEDRKVGVAGSAAARQRGLGRWQRHPVVSRLRRRARGRRRGRRPRRRPDDP